MADELVRKDDQIKKRLTDTLQAGSLADLVKEKKAQQESFLLLDRSGSMSEPVSNHGFRPKIDALREIVKELQEQVKCPMVAFGGIGTRTNTLLAPGQGIPEPSGGTPLADGIRYCKEQGARHIVVVSDGVPDDEEDALHAAAQFGGVIDVFYVGPEYGGGAAFLRRLALSTRGRCQVTTLTDTKQLTSAIRGLLPGATV